MALAPSLSGEIFASLKKSVQVVFLSKGVSLGMRTINMRRKHPWIQCGAPRQGRGMSDRIVAMKT